MFLNKKENLKKFILYRNNFLKKKFFSKKLKKKKIKFKSNKKFWDIKKKFFSTILENHKFFKIYFKNKFLKKKKLLKFLKNRKSLELNKLYSSFELLLFNVLLRTQTLHFLNNIFFFIENGYIFVNGVCERNPFLKLKVGDRVQLVINSNFYIFYKINLLKYLKKLAKIKFKVWKIHKIKFNFYKQLSKSSPNWLLNMNNYKNDIPSYLEVDFLTLTSIVLFKPFYYHHINFFLLKFISPYMFKLYFWKKLN